MPIIEFSTDEKDIPADIDRSTVVFCKDYQIGTDVWTWPTHVGLCLEDREYNGRDDSDFHMLVWDPVKKVPVDIMFATTRGWSYPSYGSSVDATPEVRAEYEAYRAQQRKEYLERETAIMQAGLKQIADASDVPVESVNRLLGVYGEQVWGHRTGAMGIRFQEIGPVGKLLTSKLRSPFRLKLRQQIVDWMKDPAPKYRTPLSPRQLLYV